VSAWQFDGAVALASVAPLALSRYSAKVVPAGPQVEMEMGAALKVGKPTVSASPGVLIVPFAFQITGASLTLQAER
jgi:hypothetical protein